MKKLITTTVITLLISYSFAQSSPCSNDIILAKKAKWKYTGKTQLANSEFAPKSMAPEFIKRIDALHNLVLEAYPEGAGTEPWWSRFLGAAPGDNKIPYVFFYESGFPFYYCSSDFPSDPDAGKNIMKCYCLEYNNVLTITANDLKNVWSGSQETFELNGKTVYKMDGYVGKWKGYDVYNLYGNPDFDERVIVIRRKGEMLPYHLVTRKEYLDHMIEQQTKLKQDFLTQENPDAPVLLTPQQEEEKKKKDLADIEKNITNPAWREKAKKEYLANYKTSRQLSEEYFNNITMTFDAEVKKYKDELSNTADSLLKSPAIVGGLTEAQSKGNGSNIFGTEKGGGNMLATENPAYFRKDLPKYIPQYFVLQWKWFGYDPNTIIKHLAAPEYYAGRIEKYFPIEKLQAMIDK